MERPDALERECGDAPTAGHRWMWFRRRESARMLAALASDGWDFPPWASLAWCARCERYRVHARGFLVCAACLVFRARDLAVNIEHLKFSRCPDTSKS